MKTLKLASGDNIPTIGLGTWQASAVDTERVVTAALQLGYRHLDTAFNYNNEEAVGRAVRAYLEHHPSREDLFITTKLPHIANRAQDVRKFLEVQLARLQLGYVDLYLVHVPFGFACDAATLAPRISPDGEYELDPATDHVAVWHALEECKEAGLVKNLGLSNFNKEQMENILDKCRIRPQVLQVEMHAHFQQRELREFCARNRIAVTAYSPLGSPGAKDHFVNKYNYSPEAFPNLMSLEAVLDIARLHGKSPAQLLLRFLLQLGVAIVPKTTSEARLQENLDIYDFELSVDEMNILEGLDKGEDGRIFNFLFWKGVEKHPQYPFKHLLKNIEVENNDS